MDFDLEHTVIDTAADLFAFALKEASTQAQWNKAVDEIIVDVRKRYPDISMVNLAFAMGRALGRLEAEEKRR